MILRRLGNKQQLAKEIQKHFPIHSIYIEPFFGAGGMFFNKPKAKTNILNDLDGDVINLFNIITERGGEFLNYLELTPYSSELFDYWKKNEEIDPIKKAVRFIYLSNFGYLGQQTVINIDDRNHKKNAIINFNNTIEFIKDCSLKFTNFDFRKAITSIKTTEEKVVERTFVYADPPYLGTMDNYSNSFKDTDSIDLFNLLIKSGCKFAMSEFDHPLILEQANDYGLNTIIIGERKNLKNRRTEILVTNYENRQQSLFA